MVCNFKTLGLALVGLFAMSAVTASSASAQLGKVTSDGIISNVTIKATDTGAELDNSFTVTIFGSTTILRCPVSHYTGHKLNTTPHEPIAIGATGITGKPEYTNCTDGTNKLTVTMNGCDYELTDATTTAGVAGTYGVAFAIRCPAGKVIEITGGTCKVTVGEQTDLTGLHLTNTPEGGGRRDSVDLTGTINIAALVCGFATTTVYHVDIILRGYNFEGIEKGLTVSDS
jgi:hypothetical protein